MPGEANPPGVIPSPRKLLSPGHKGTKGLYLPKSAWQFLGPGTLTALGDTQPWGALRAMLCPDTHMTLAMLDKMLSFPLPVAAIMASPPEKCREIAYQLERCTQVLR